MTYQHHAQDQLYGATFMRSPMLGDRRRYQRFEQHGLMARIGDTLLEMRDISVGGMCVARLEQPVGAEIAMTLFPRDGQHLDLGRSLVVRGEVLGHVDHWTRLRFVGMTYSLAKFLVQHLARCHGVEPYIFK